MAKFDLYLENNIVSIPEEIKIGINDITILHSIMPIEKFSFELDLDDDNHILWIELCNKNPQNEHRVNGELINDTYINVKNIAIDNSMMNYLLNDNGYVIPDWNHHKDVATYFEKTYGHIPEKLEKSKYINFKSKYCFHFTLPIREFLSKNIKIHPDYEKYYNQSLTRYIALEQKLLSIKTIQ